MNSLAFVFTYNRLDVARESIRSIFEASEFVPERVVFIDDGSREPVVEFLREAKEKYDNKAEIEILAKKQNAGFSDSALTAFNYAKAEGPNYLFFIESDYVFPRHGLDVVMDCFENTNEGQMAVGIVGYDHPLFGFPDDARRIFSRGMNLQMGFDNVNRDALHKTREVVGSKFRFGLQLTSNTCWSCYLNWHRLLEVSDGQPEIWDYLQRACCPRPQENYPESGLYASQRTVDDGMLSHAVNVVWNKWAIRRNVDRDRFAAWLNIKPSVAEHRHLGGMHG